jgi:precorrin-6B methylase 2
MASPLNERVTTQLRDLLAGDASPERLNAALRQLSKWRSVLIQNTWTGSNGTKVRDGVFAGMDFIAQSAEGCHIAKLLGTYEQPLQAAVERAIARDYRTVINIGCAEGYYAVGLARRMPQAKILAFDIDAKARTACAELAAKNGVSDRVEVGPEFTPADFARYRGASALVVCDIEGAEHSLLDPVAAPALTGMDLLVEAHDCDVAGLSQTLRERFEPTHAVSLIADSGSRDVESPPDWFTKLGHLDQLLAVWEWRIGPTPWLEIVRR